jgi:hypothetical protein
MTKLPPPTKTHPDAFVPDEVDVEEPGDEPTQIEETEGVPDQADAPETDDEGPRH